MNKANSNIDKSKIEKEKILKFIIDYITWHGYSPSIREICAGLSISSTSVAYRHMESMFKHGVIETDAAYGTPRAIRVPGYQFVKKEDLVNEDIGR